MQKYRISPTTAVPAFEREGVLHRRKRGKKTARETESIMIVGTRRFIAPGMAGMYVRPRKSPTALVNSNSKIALTVEKQEVHSDENGRLEEPWHRVSRRDDCCCDGREDGLSIC
jgi:hypothetical protein